MVVQGRRPLQCVREGVALTSGVGHIVSRPFSWEAEKELQFSVGQSKHVCTPKTHNIYSCIDLYQTNVVCLLINVGPLGVINSATSTAHRSAIQPISSLDTSSSARGSGGDIAH